MRTICSRRRGSPRATCWTSEIGSPASVLRDFVSLDRVQGPERRGPAGPARPSGRPRRAHRGPPCRPARPGSRYATSRAAMFGDFSASISPSTVPKSYFGGFAAFALRRDPVDPPGRLVAEGVAADGRRRTSRRRRPTHRAPRRRRSVGTRGRRCGRATLSPTVRNEAPVRVSGKWLICRVPASASRTAPWILLGQQVALVDHDPARAAVAGADELRHVAGHLLAPVPGAAGGAGSRTCRRP